MSLVQISSEPFRAGDLPRAALRTYVLGLSEAREMRTAEVAEMLGATEVTAMKGLTALVEHGLAVRSVTWRGSRPMSTWRVVAPQAGSGQ